MYMYRRKRKEEKEEKGKKERFGIWEGEGGTKDDTIRPMDNHGISVNCCRKSDGEQCHVGEADDVVDRLIDCVKSYKIVISSGGWIDAVRPKREPMTNLQL